MKKIFFILVITLNLYSNDNNVNFKYNSLTNQYEINEDGKIKFLEINDNKNNKLNEYNDNNFVKFEQIEEVKQDSYKTEINNEDKKNITNTISKKTNENKKPYIFIIFLLFIIYILYTQRIKLISPISKKKLKKETKKEQKEENKEVIAEQKEIKKEVNNKNFISLSKLDTLRKQERKTFLSFKSSNDKKEILNLFRELNKNIKNKKDLEELNKDYQNILNKIKDFKNV